jgi:hypothetical protein
VVGPTKRKPRRFSPSQPSACDGDHPEIETALVELARATGEERYLEQARLFVERRGRGLLGDHELGQSYFQDDLPVRAARVLRGHAVRALYLACGAVDVAVETGDRELLEAVAGQWRNTLAARTYLTGGMGSRHPGEAIGEDFELPPDRAYAETCAGVTAVMLAWRLLLATGERHYADAIERTLYNVVAAAPAMDGRSFFYANPLQQRVPGHVIGSGNASPHAASGLRSPWFAVSCCPTNLARMLASLAGYVATVDDGGLQLHQLTACTVRASLPDGRGVGLRVETGYPWAGAVTVRVTEAAGGPWRIDRRVPGWADGAVLAYGDLRRGWGPGTGRWSGTGGRETSSASTCRWPRAGPGRTRGSTPSAAASPPSGVRWSTARSRSTRTPPPAWTRWRWTPWCHRPRRAPTATSAAPSRSAAPPAACRSGRPAGRPWSRR